MSFRRYGGLNYAAKNNIVGSNYNTANNLLVTDAVGEPNSYINFLSDISGNAGYFNTTSDYRIKENVKVLNYNGLVPILVKEIQDLKIEIQNLKLENKSLNEKIETILIKLIN